MSDYERRMTYRVTSEWVGLNREGSFPSIDFLHPKTFSVDWDQCVLVRRLDPPPASPGDDLEFEFVGSTLRQDAPSVTAGTRVSSIPAGSLLSLSLPLLPQMFDRQKPVIYSGCLPWRESGSIHFRTIAVPFGDSAGALKYALAAESYKVSAEVAPPQDHKTEFLEYVDGGWLAIDGEREFQLGRVA